MAQDEARTVQPVVFYDPGKARPVSAGKDFSIRPLPADAPVVPDLEPEVVAELEAEVAAEEQVELDPKDSSATASVALSDLIPTTDAVTEEAPAGADTAPDPESTAPEKPTSSSDQPSGTSEPPAALAPATTPTSGSVRRPKVVTPPSGSASSAPSEPSATTTE